MISMVAFGRMYSLAPYGQYATCFVLLGLASVVEVLCLMLFCSTHTEPDESAAQYTANITVEEVLNSTHALLLKPLVSATAIRIAVIGCVQIVAVLGSVFIAW